MANKTLMTQLPKTHFSGLEFSNIMEDIHNLVKENPEFNSNWDDFLNSNAGRMLTEVFAWIADQLATRIDWVVNENFIGTATSRTSIIRLLKLIGYKFSLPVAATIPVTLEFSLPVANNYNLTPTYIEGSGIISPKKIQGNDKKGNLKSFEALNYDSINQKYSYKVPVVVNVGDISNPTLKQEINFYEGTTKIKSFIAVSNQGQKFIIDDSPIVRNSIAVYIIRTQGVEIEESELLEVDNFLDSNAQKVKNSQGETNAIPYVLNVRDDDSVEIEFAPITLLPNSDRRLPEGSELRVFYRIGGGLDGNIARQSINLTERIVFDSQEVVVSYYNEREGIGGQDTETVEHAAYNGPLNIRTGGKAVTTEDYDIILSGHTNILLSKSYGYNNIPYNYYNKYGTYFNPMEIMNYVILKKSGWETVPTSKYYLADWGSFNLENKFNGVYFFNNGLFGNEINLKNNHLKYEGVYDYDNQGGREFKNYNVLRTPNSWKKSLFIETETGYIANMDLLASLTKMKYDKTIHTKIQQITEHLVYDIDDSYFHGDYLDTDFPRIEIREDINAYFRSNRDVTSGLNISNGRNRFMIDVDGHGNVIVDLSRGETSPNIVPLDTSETIYGIIDTINEAIGIAYQGVFAYQDFGILIQDTMAQVPNLENRDEENWILRISGINYTVNTGVDQSYTNMLAAMNTAINSAGYEALFIQNHVNITCYDIRIQRTSLSETVILEDSNDPYDILVAFEAAPLSTSPVSSGDYSTVATKVTDSDGSYVKLTSPNKGSASSITLKPSVSLAQNCLLSLFGLDIETDERNIYTCYGQRALTVIYRDNLEPDFGDFIYEHGTINFSSNDPEFVYLNFIKEKKNKIKIGYYFNESFDISDPEWKPIDKRIYNTSYKVDPEDLEGKREYFDIDNSNLILKFTNEEERGNSIFTINNDYPLTRANHPSITSKFIHTFPNTTGKNLTIQVSNNFSKIILLDGITTIAELSDVLNSNLVNETNEMFHGALPFSTIDVDESGEGTITFQIDNNKAGKITIIGNSNSIADSLFDEISNIEVDYTVYSIGDYYLELDTSTDSINMVKIESAQNIPDTPFYIHYVADRRHIFLDPEVEKIHTDEDDLQAYMYPYKVAGIQNTFARPVFTTFDIRADVYYSKAIPKEQIQFNVDKTLRAAYGLSAAEFNKPIIKSEVTKVIMDISGVRYVEVKYFGTTMNDLETNVDNRIEAGFDEIIVLSSDTFDVNGSQIHGQNLSYNVV